MRLLNRAGLAVVVVTNQSGWRADTSTEPVESTWHLADVLARGGARVDGYYCPHHPEGRVAAYRMGATAASRAPACCCERRRS